VVVRQARCHSSAVRGAGFAYRVLLKEGLG
jgi:hypothetical protein